MFVLPSLHERKGTLSDLDTAVFLQRDAVIEDLLVTLQHELLELELVHLNSSEKILLPLLAILVDILQIDFGR